jgi:tripartite ATP-independent transporter DctM subunit
VVEAVVFLAAAMFLGVPVAYALIGASLLYFLTGPVPVEALTQKLTASLASFPLLAIPFFMLAGVLMSHGGIARRIIDVADAFVGHFRGGLAQVSVFNSLLMGGMSGSSTADAAVDAKVLVPQMIRKGYERGTAAAFASVSGVIVVLIPPSIGLIVYGLVAQVSVGELFIAGVGPGILLAVALSVCVRVMAGRGRLPASRSKAASFKERLSTTGKAFWALMMPVLLILGLRAGVFTPTELGAVAAVYALVVGVVVYREISWRDVGAHLQEAAGATGVVMLILAAAAGFGVVMTHERIPQRFAEGVFAITDNPIVVLIIINVGLLVLGALTESLALMILVAPILAPLAADLGIDPVHFGIIIVLNLAIGGVTPPIGVVMFTVLSITKTGMWEYTKATWPLLVSVLVVLGLVSYVPAISLWLPDLLLR